ncbi:MAG: ATP-binding cassette domain-containing protein [Culicoidibacterales bacterium]
MRRNQTIALLGKNGSGKSTFVQILLGIVPEFAFTIECDNQKFGNC